MHKSTESCQIDFAFTAYSLYIFAGELNFSNIVEAAMKTVPYILTFLLLTTLSDAQLKKRVAVSVFEDRSGAGYNHLGAGVADMLVTALVKSGKFIVIERAELDKVLNEQKLGESGLVTPESAPKIGKLLGAELFVVGSVSEFGTKESNIGGSVPLFGAALKTKTARAVVDVRLVNTTSGEIIAAETKEGSESSTGVAVSYESIDFNNMDSWDDTDAGKATREAVNGVVELITENMTKIPWMGKILKVNADGTVLMKPGSEGNVKPGMDFDVFRVGEDVIDPDTGMSLGAEETKVATIKVTDDALKGKAAKAKVIDGKDLQNNDVVREPN
jgi:curli biogenesis system outer membrane secretion channel CsgG